MLIMPCSRQFLTHYGPSSDRESPILIFHSYYLTPHSSPYIPPSASAFPTTHLIQRLHLHLYLSSPFLANQSNRGSLLFSIFRHLLDPTNEFRSIYAPKLERTPDYPVRHLTVLSMSPRATSKGMPSHFTMEMRI